jgi:DnaJ-class molecular chaperone
MKRKAKRPSPFSKNYAPYGRYEGPRGNADEWAKAFGERLPQAEIEEILGDDSPWGILGVKAGATQDEIKSAFFRRAKETHPDRNPGKDGSEFRKVRAAYEQLTPI